MRGSAAKNSVSGAWDAPDLAAEGYDRQVPNQADGRGSAQLKRRMAVTALVITPATAVMPPLASGMAVWAEWIAVVAVVAVTVPDR